MQKTCIDYLKMHAECTILMQFLQKFPGEAPRTPTCGRGWPPPPPSPFRRFAPQWSLRLHWSLVPPRQWRFWIRPWNQIHFHIRLFHKIFWNRVFERYSIACIFIFNFKVTFLRFLIFIFVNLLHVGGNISFLKPHSQNHLLTNK